MLRRISEIQRALYEGKFHEGLYKMERMLQNEISKVMDQEELLWYQRSRVNWLIEGDKNTWYYTLKLCKEKEGT